LAGDQGAGGGVSGLPIALVAAVARNGVIGADNRLIWRLSTDLKRFRALTWGKPLVMGRKTFQAIGKPLPGRETIVVTREAGYASTGVHVAHDIETALTLAEEVGRRMEANEIIVAGGGEIYLQTIDRADRLFLTEVALEPTGDAFFPPVDPALWREVRRQSGERTVRDEADFTFVDYARRTE
jgi:dihydrofolate reductase